MTTLTRNALDHVADEVLADRAADGDTRAFTALARRYRRLLHGYATRILGSRADSEDVVQDTLVTAWAQLPNLRDRSMVRAWLLQITTRNALDVIGRRRHHDDITEVEVTDPTDGPAQQSATQSVQAALDRNLASLPAQQRQAWVLRELGGHSYDEIATELGVPVSTVRGLLSRARTTLIHNMEDWR